MNMTQGNDLHLVTRGYTTGSVKAAGDLVTTRGKRTRGRRQETVIEEDQDGDPWSSYYRLIYSYALALKRSLNRK